MHDSGELKRALVLFAQKVERRTIAVIQGDATKAALEQTNLSLAAEAVVALFDGDEPEQLDLDPPNWATGWGSLTAQQRHAQRERWKEQLLPVVKRLAATREAFVAGDVISLGITEHILNGERVFLSKHRNVYAWVGQWLAALARAGVLERLTLRTDRGGTVEVRGKTERTLSKGNFGYSYRAGRAA